MDIHKFNTSAAQRKLEEAATEMMLPKTTEPSRQCTLIRGHFSHREFPPYGSMELWESVLTFCAAAGTEVKFDVTLDAQIITTNYHFAKAGAVLFRDAGFEHYYSVHEKDKAPKKIEKYNLDLRGTDVEGFKE